MDQGRLVPDRSSCHRGRKLRRAAICHGCHVRGFPAERLQQARAIDESLAQRGTPLEWPGAAGRRQRVGDSPCSAVLSRAAGRRQPSKRCPRMEVYLAADPRRCSTTTVQGILTPSTAMERPMRCSNGSRPPLASAVGIAVLDSPELGSEASSAAGGPSALTLSHGGLASLDGDRARFVGASSGSSSPVNPVVCRKGALQLQQQFSR